MPYTLRPLPYASEDLEPFCDKATVEIHHGKHHATYVEKLNEVLAGHPAFADQTVEELVFNLESVPEGIHAAVRRYAGGHANHSLFWRTIGPPKSSEPFGALVGALTGTFGSITTFKEKFAQSAESVFGSGWTWLAVGARGQLSLWNTQNQDSPLSHGARPILALDLWEHAYYLKFRNRRAEWIDSWWKVVDWDEVSILYLRAISESTLRKVYAEENFASQLGGISGGRSPVMA
jgi:Fe-Mn family superoxide dismutase